MEKANERQQSEFTPRELYRLKKILNGNGSVGGSKSDSSDDVAFDTEELALVVKEAVHEALDEYYEASRGDQKNGGKREDESERKPKRRFL
jgi:hypothetical protein